VITASLLSWGVLCSSLMVAAGEPEPAVQLERVGAVVLEGGAAVLEPLAGGLLWIDAQGRVRRLEASGSTGAFEPVPCEDPPRLADPARTLVGLGQLGLGGGFLALSTEGARWYPLDADGRPTLDSLELARRARFELRVGAPRYAPLFLDLDSDGIDELLVPGLERVGLWRMESSGDQADRPRLRRALEVEVPTTVFAATERADLSQRLAARVSIPGLKTDDLDGDGRLDLIVEGDGAFGFHLADQVGNFSLEPDRRLELGLFRDESSEAGSTSPGGTLALGGKASVTRRDLDGDGIPDFAIAAGRKVWVFPATPEGPQFERPSTILKSGEDVTKALIVEVDADGRPDLVLLRLEVPSVATLVFGLVREFDVVLRADGYRNQGEGRFETRPAWGAEVRFRLPPILDLVGDPMSFLDDFRAAGSRYRLLADGDLDGDGAADVVALTEGGDALEVWLGAEAEQGVLTREALDALVADALFGPGSKVWTLERVADFLGEQGGGLLRRATGGGAPTIRIELDGDAGAVERLTCVVPGGSERASLVVVRSGPDLPTRVETFRVAR
jgi:hypothetical protein